jgi:hypothetical protein
MLWECADCCNEFEGPKKPARCSECGSRKVIAQDTYERERDADDGLSYGDPRDERDERRAL